MGHCISDINFKVEFCQPFLISNIINIFKGKNSQWIYSFMFQSNLHCNVFSHKDAQSRFSFQHFVVTCTTHCNKYNLHRQQKMKRKRAEKGFQDMFIKWQLCWKSGWQISKGVIWVIANNMKNGRVHIDCNYDYICVIITLINVMYRYR